jgi:O-antigen ligase
MDHVPAFRTRSVLDPALRNGRQSSWVVALACSSLVLAWLVADGGSVRAAAAFALLPVGAVVLSRSENRLLVAIAMITVLPWWYTLGGSQAKISVVAPLLALTGMFGAVVIQRRSSFRVDLIDIALGGFVAAVALSWAFVGPYTYHSLTAAILWGLPLGFYLSARSLGFRAWRPICWALLIAGTAASLPLFYEFFVIHRPLFNSGTFYYWNVGLFRPGGAFGGPPQAVCALSMTTLAGLSLLVTTAGPRRVVVSACLVVSIGAIIITFTRAGLIGLALGVVVFLALWRPAALARSAYVFAILGLIFAVAVLPQLTGKSWYQEGVNRHGTLSDRQARWTAAWPVVTNSTQHLFLGHGFNSLLVGHPLGLAGQPQADLAATPILIDSSPHSQYIRTLLEQGLTGLALLLAWLLAAVGRAAIGARKVIDRGDRALLAGCAAGIVSFMVVSLVDDTLRDPSSLALVALLAGLVAARRAHDSEAASPQGVPAASGA